MEVIGVDEAKSTTEAKSGGSEVGERCLNPVFTALLASLKVKPEAERAGRVIRFNPQVTKGVDRIV